MGQDIQEWTKWNLLKAAFDKIYLVHFWIPWPIFGIIYNSELQLVSA